MISLLHGTLIALGLIVVVVGFVAFWRGLALKPHPPEERPPERWGSGF
jgi:hypothetical protein